MKNIKRIISAVTAAVMLMGTVIISPVTSSAAGITTHLQTLFENEITAKEPQMVVPDSAKESGLDPDGAGAWTYQIQSCDSGTKFGFPSSAGKIAYAHYNNPDFPESSLAGREVVFFGTYFKNHNTWGNYSKSIDDYKETASMTITVKVPRESESYYDDLYVYIKSYPSSTHSFSAVKIDSYYSRDEIDTIKTISIPIKKFMSNDEDVYKINGGFDPNTLSGAGLMLVNPTSEEEGYLYYDNVYVCNILSPTSLGVTDLSSNSVSLSWSPSDSDVTGYAVYRNGEKIGETGASELSYSDDNLEEMANYTYTVRALDKYGAESVDSNAVDLFVSPVGRPENFNAVSSFDDALQVKLSWEAPKFGDADLFNIYRNDELIASVSNDTYEYTDSEGLVENNEYTYYVTAQTADGIESMVSDSVKLSAAFIKRPTELKAETFSDERRIALSWNTIENAVGYIIECNGSELARTTENTGSYIHENIEYSTLYIYRVKAYNQNGVVSLPTDEVYVTVDHPEISTDGYVLFDDSVGTGFDPKNMENGAAKGKYTTVAGDAAKGEKSFDISFTTGTSLLHGFAFEVSSKSIDLSSMHNGRGIISMYVKADKDSVVNDIKVGLQCTSDKILDSTYTVITSVPLVNYLKTYGSWAYVEIPVSDFAEKGTYYHDAAELFTDFKFNEVTGIDFILDGISTQPVNKVRFDEVKITEYKSADITGITTENGTELDASAENPINTSTKELNFTFAYKLDPETVNSNTITLVPEPEASETPEEGSGEGEENAPAEETKPENIPLLVSYDDSSSSVYIQIASPLKKGTKYKLVFSGVHTANGAELNTPPIKLVTSDEEAQIDGYTDSSFSVKTDSVSAKSGNTANVKMTLEGAAAKAYVTGGKITLTFPKTLLTVSEKDIEISPSLAAMGVTPVVSKGEITFDLNGLSAEKPVMIGSLLADIKFKASGAGSDSIKTEGNVKVVSNSTEKTVPVKSEKAFATVTTGGTSGGSSSSSGGSASSAGGRDEAVGTKATTPPAPVTNPVDKGTSLADAAEVGWAEEAINYLTSKGFVNGYEDNTFRPNNNVTREEFAAMLIRALGIEEKDGNAEFSDVKKDDWYYSVVRTAAAAGIAAGYDGMFGAGRTITRQDMCTMVYRAAKLAEMNIPENYGAATFADDSDIADYAKESISALQRAGIVNGVENNRFEPAGIVTRAMAAKVLHGLLTVQPNTRKNNSADAPETERSAGTAKNSESATRLKMFGVLTSEDINSEQGENVTGAEFVNWVIKSTGFGDAYGGDKAVDGARELGYISDGDEFTADGALKYNTAVKIIMDVLGYREMAEQKGGYPEGYLAVAGHANVLKGVVPESDGTITRSSAIKMLDNSLESDMMGISAKGDKVEVKNGTNILNSFLDIEKYSGKIDSVDRSAKSVTFTADKETQTFNLADSMSIYSVITDKADIYVKNDEIVYIYYRGTIQVMYDFIEEVNGDNDSNKEYMTSGIRDIYLTNAAKKYKANKSLSVYYEDESTEWKSAPLAGSFAQLTVKDGEVLEIQAYPLYEGGIIYHASLDMIKYTKGSSSSNTIQGFADIDELMIFVDGQPVDEITQLAPDMVFDYWLNEEEDKFLIVASSRIFTGELKSRGTDYVGVDGREYDVSTRYGYYAYNTATKRYEKCESGSTLIKDYTGKKAKFFVDDRKQLRYIRASETALNENTFLGVVMKAIYDDAGGIEPSGVKFELYNVSDGTGEKIYDVADSIKKSPVSLEYAISVARNTEGKGFFKFTLNSEGKIAKIETPQYWGHEFTFNKEITDKTPYIIGQISVKYATLFTVCNVDGEFTVTTLDWDTNLKQTNFGGGVTVISDYDAKYNPIPEYVMFASGSENLQSGDRTEWITDIRYLEDDKAQLTLWNLWGSSKYIVDAKTADKYKAPSLVKYRSWPLQAEQAKIKSVICSGPSDTWNTDDWADMKYGFFKADKILYSDDEVVQFQVNGQPTNVMHLGTYFYVVEYIDGKKPTIKRQTGQMPMGYIKDGDNVWFYTGKQEDYDISVDIVIYETNGMAPKE